MTEKSTIDLILSGLVTDENYTRKVLPHLKPDYFDEAADQRAYQIVNDFINQYNKTPTREAMIIELDKSRDLSQSVVNQTMNRIDDMFGESSTALKELSIPWLVDRTEEHCRDSSIQNSVMESLSIINGEHKTLDKNAIPELFRDALSVSFDSRVGHDYFEDHELRYEYYHRKQERIELPLEMMNKITKGGLPRKTLNIAIAPTGVGKTFFMTYCSSHFLTQGHNVLYLTLEMDEESISKRVDAALLDTTLDDLQMFPRGTYTSRIQNLKKKTSGRMITKQYPPGSASTAHFRYIIDELRIKKDFVPDVIIVDYLNLCASTRFKSRDNSYMYMKSITEELRGLAIEYNVCMMTATQANRSANGATDYDLNEISESFGIAMGADFVFGMISTDELEEKNQIRFKQLKNRYGAITPKSFVVGITRAKMQMFNADTSFAPTLTQQTTNGGGNMTNGGGGRTSNVMHGNRNSNPTSLTDRIKF